MEKPDPAKDERESTPDSDFASIVKAEADKSKRASKRKTDDPDHKKSYRRSWRSASPLTKLMIYFTALAAVSTLIYAFFAGWQWYEIHSGGEETRKIAQAARDSADAAERALSIAEENSRGVLFIKDISFPPRLTTDKKEIFLYITWGNDGNSIVQIKRDGLRYFVSGFHPSISDARNTCSQVRSNPSSLVIPAKSPRKQRFTTRLEPLKPEQIADVIGLRLYFGICGQLDYLTLGKIYPLLVCTYYDPEENTYVDCLSEGQR